MTKQAYRESQRIKPMGIEGIEKCREVLKTGQYQKINEVLIDGISAGAIIAVYDKLSSEKQQMLLSFPIAKTATICMKLCTL